jgi:hypothetical protein
MITTIEFSIENLNFSLIADLFKKLFFQFNKSRAHSKYFPLEKKISSHVNFQTSSKLNKYKLVTIN